jgi:hypothetical protein
MRRGPLQRWVRRGRVGRDATQATRRRLRGRGVDDGRRCQRSDDPARHADPVGASDFGYFGAHQLQGYPAYMCPCPTLPVRRYRRPRMVGARMVRYSFSCMTLAFTTSRRFIPTLSRRRACATKRPKSRRLPKRQHRDHNGAWARCRPTTQSPARPYLERESSFPLSPSAPALIALPVARPVLRAPLRRPLPAFWPITSSPAPEREYHAARATRHIAVFSLTRIARAGYTPELGRMRNEKTMQTHYRAAGADRRECAN